MDAGRIAELKKMLTGQEGLAAGLCRAAVGEYESGNKEFVRGLQESITGLPDESPLLQAIAKELENSL